MPRFNQHWRIGKLDFYLVQGDIFEIPADAIVNSEQTDFKLSGDLSTISGQIWQRYGKDVQQELDKQTKGEILPPGTVLRASDVGQYVRIYHAGFHHPQVWLDNSEEDNQTEHIQVIRSCIQQILEDLQNDELNSIAFPLIGCGIFGLDPALLAYQFIDEVVKASVILNSRGQKAVWLVVHREDLLQRTLNAVVQAFIDRSSEKNLIEPLHLGIAYLDRFEKNFLRSQHPPWLAWMLTRYCELLTGFFFFHLSGAVKPPVNPEQVIEQNLPAAFGIIRTYAEKLAQNSIFLISDIEWPHFFAELILKDLEKDRRLERINVDRNNIAHGRVFRDVEEIYQDIIDFVCLSGWRDMVEKIGDPGIDRLEPWVIERSTNGYDVGVLERWNLKHWTYLVPYTGLTFKLQR
jgi:O-acetyl-ADP-ribose deacetylase (regulator of RNase III)